MSGNDSTSNENPWANMPKPVSWTSKRAANTPVSSDASSEQNGQSSSNNRIYLDKYAVPSTGEREYPEQTYGPGGGGRRSRKSKKSRKSYKKSRKSKKSRKTRRYRR